MPTYDDGSTPTLVTEKPPAVTYAMRTAQTGANGKGALASSEVTFTIAATQDQTLFQPKPRGYVVRRLTPMECERLQGFPDGWTDLTGCDVDAVTDLVAASLLYDEKAAKALRRKVEKWSQECPDGPRYKACGNSMAVPNMRWIFDRIQAYECLRETAVVAKAWLDRERRF